MQSDTIVTLHKYVKEFKNVLKIPIYNTYCLLEMENILQKGYKLKSFYFHL